MICKRLQIKRSIFSIEIWKFAELSVRILETILKPNCTIIIQNKLFFYFYLAVFCTFSRTRRFWTFLMQRTIGNGRSDRNGLAFPRRIGKASLSEFAEISDRTNKFEGLGKFVELGLGYSLKPSFHCWTALIERRCSRNSLLWSLWARLKW